jgi:PAT family beta-lactamase induction signal transducer AmpG
MSSHYLRIFQQPKSAILLILGFASGLPLALTSGTLQAWMTVENIDLKTIGFFSLVGQAYVFKFLWSPVMDRYAAVPRASSRLAGDDAGPAAAGHCGDGVS